MDIEFIYLYPNPKIGPSPKPLLDRTRAPTSAPQCSHPPRDSSRLGESRQMSWPLAQPVA